MSLVQTKALTGVHTVCPAACTAPALHLNMLALMRLGRVAFGMVGHEDAKQTEYALRIVRAHCLDVLALYANKGWHV